MVLDIHIKRLLLIYNLNFETCSQLKQLRFAIHQVLSL